MQWGVTPILHYDPLGRLIRTEFPDGTESKVVFDAWYQETWDQNDCVTGSRWLTERLAAGAPADERTAAIQTQVHADTPSVAYFDSLGRAYLAVEDNGTHGSYETRMVFDIEGNIRSVIDQRGITAFTYKYDIAGTQVYTSNSDAGERWIFTDTMGNPLCTWDSRDHVQRFTYDALRRATHTYVQQGANPEQLMTRTIYSESLSDPLIGNHRGKVYQVFDGAGLLTNNTYDFKGNLLSSTRHIAREYHQTPNWDVIDGLTDVNEIWTAAQSSLETESYSSGMTYAHGSMVSMPHISQLNWNYVEQLQSTDLGGGGIVYYCYDSSGNRSRKVYEHSGITEDRIYLGGYEIYRKTRAGTVELERETLHVSDDTKRIVLFETKTADVDNPAGIPQVWVRWQLDNHLGSSGTELDNSAQVISYEEYHPIGSTSFHTVDSGAEVSAKRYRYTGKERDDETGLYYYGARYYASWLGRWTGCDPKVEDGWNLYVYVRNNPTIRIDPDGTTEKDKINVTDDAYTKNPDHDYKIKEKGYKFGDVSISDDNLSLTTALPDHTCIDECVNENHSPLGNFKEDSFVKEWAFEFIALYSNLLSKNKLDYTAYNLLEHWLYGEGKEYTLSQLEIDNLPENSENGLTFQPDDNIKNEIVNMINSYSGVGVTSKEISGTFKAAGVKTVTLGNFTIDFEGVAAVDYNEFAIFGTGIYKDRYDFDVKLQNVFATNKNTIKQPEKYTRPQAAEFKVLVLRAFQKVTGLGEDFNITANPTKRVYKNKYRNSPQQ